MSEFAIRRARDADFEALQQIYRRASLSNPDDRAGLLAHPDFLCLDDDLIGRGRTWVAALDGDGTVIGFASTSRLSNTDLELDNLFVASDWRRHGAGRQLVERIIEEAAEQGATSIEVTGNNHALSFYRAVGFTDETSTTTPLGACVRMRMPIN